MQTNKVFASIMNTSMSYKVKMFDMIDAKNSTILDFGGGSGVLGILYAMMYPQSTVYLWDELSEMRVIMQNNIDSAGISNVHVLQSADALTSNFYDYVLLSSVVHELVASSETLLFEKTLQLLSKISSNLIIRDGLFINNHKHIKYKVVDQQRYNEFMEEVQKYKDDDINVIRDEIEPYISSSRVEEQLYLEGRASAVHNLLNKMTWGTASLEREIKENFLCHNNETLSKTLDSVNQVYQTQLKLTEYLEIKQDDYFEYIGQLVEIAQDWNTHYIAKISNY